MSAAQVGNTVKSIFDPGHLLLKPDKDPTQLPDYITQTGQGAAASFKKNLAIANGGGEYTGPGGTAFKQEGAGVPVADLLAPTGPDPRLDPKYNPYLSSVGQWGGDALTGALAARNGGDAATSANADAIAAAKGITDAGNTSRFDAVNGLAQARGQLSGINGQIGRANSTLDASARDMRGLRDAANGRVQSAAEIQQRAALDASARQQVAAAATARGGNIAAAQRNASLAANAGNLAGMQQLGALRAQEQAGARTTLAGANAAQIAGATGVAGAAVGAGNVANGITTTANGIYSSDVDRAAKAAGALGDTSKIAAANFGTGAGVATSGLGALGGASSTYANGQANAVSAEQKQKDMYAQWLNNQIALGMGMAPTASSAGSFALGMDQNNIQKDAADSATRGTILAGLLG